MNKFIEFYGDQLGPSITKIYELDEFFGGREMAKAIFDRVRESLLSDRHLSRLWKLDGKAEYDIPTFAYNVECLCEDIEHGALRKPLSADGWVELIVHQYKGAVWNVGLCPEYGPQLRRTEAKWRVKK